jgi:hypothetical protein
MSNNLRVKGIVETMEKLENQCENGENVLGDLEFISDRGGEYRYTYRLGKDTVFTFGITRGSNIKEKYFSYVPKQMGLSNSEYNRLHDCPMSKKEYNNLAIQRKFSKFNKKTTS